MHPWKLLIKLLLITLLAFTASGVVSAKVASGPQNFGLGPLQGQSLFNPLPCLEKTGYSTADAPGCSVEVKKGMTEEQISKAKQLTQEWDAAHQLK